MRRRDLLRGAAASVAGVALPGFAPIAFSQVTGASGITVTPLADGITVLTGAGGNMLARQTSDGEQRSHCLLLIRGETAAGDSLRRSQRDL